MSCETCKHKAPPSGYPAARRAGGADPLDMIDAIMNGRRRRAGGGGCSAFPEAQRRQVIAAWEPVARVYQAFAVFQIQMLPGLLAIQGPLAIMTGPFVVLGVLLNVLPYIVVELLIDCNVTTQLKRQAKMAREALELMDKVPDFVPIPGLSDLKRAAQLARGFLRSVESGKLPTTAQLTEVAQAGGLLDDMPPEFRSTMGTVLTTAKQVKAIPASAKAQPNPWTRVAAEVGQAPDDEVAVIADFAVAELRGWTPARAGGYSPRAFDAARAAVRRAGGAMELAKAKYAKEKAKQGGFPTLKAMADALKGTFATKYPKIEFDRMYADEVKRRAIADAKVKARASLEEKAKANAAAAVAAGKPSSGKGLAAAVAVAVVIGGGALLASSRSKRG